SPDYAINISAHHGNETLAAVVYRPADRGWLGTTADRSLRGTLTPRLSPPCPAEQAKITISRPHDPECYADAMMLREFLLPHVVQERRVGSAACALLQVATGQLDTYISVDLPTWDTAAGHCLVERAGGAIVKFHFRERPVCVAGGLEIVAAIAEVLGRPPISASHVCIDDALSA